MKDRFKGQAVTEFGLIMGCVLILCVVALSPLGKNLADFFMNMVPKAPSAISMGSGGLPAGAPGAPPVASASGNASAGTSGAGSSAGGTASPAMPSAGDVPMPQNISKLVQTAGANGTTQVMADQIKQIGEHLLATGEITQAQANAFYELANQGNRISTMEKLIEDAMKSGSQTVTFEGQTMTPFELSRKVGWLDEPSQDYTAPVETGQDVLNRSPAYRSESMQAFLSSYQTLVNTGAMSNAQVSTAVGSLSAKIAYLSEIMEFSVSGLHYGNTTTSLQDSVISNTSYWNSDQICGTGGGSTIGVTCQ